MKVTELLMPDPGEKNEVEKSLRILWDSGFTGTTASVIATGSDMMSRRVYPSLHQLESEGIVKSLPGDQWEILPAVIERLAQTRNEFPFGKVVPTSAKQLRRFIAKITAYQMTVESDSESWRQADMLKAQANEDLTRAQSKHQARTATVIALVSLISGTGIGALVRPLLDELWRQLFEKAG